MTFKGRPNYWKYHVPNVLSFTEPVYYDPTDYFDITQHEVDRQDELEYEVRTEASAAQTPPLRPVILTLFSNHCRRWSSTSPASRINWG